ncbi:nodulation efficiency, NfeD-like protein [Litchfieldella rifensis]|uniref:Nodulation efficiency, NfeD-like protein n=1 Tax=Litchfieldella rifensis TaxID=762643 RepID=A0ABV7LK43_9GAMM
MDWTLAHTWLAIALLLGLAELTSGAMVLLALAVAAALTALLAYLELTLPWQLLGFGVFAGLLIPLAIKVIRPRFSPHGVAYGTTGTGVEKGREYRTLKRDFDGATGIVINGDFYRLRVAETATTELSENTPVIFQKFDGTTAIVTLASQKEQ